MYPIIILIFISSSLPFFPCLKSSSTYCRWRGLFSHLITLNDTHIRQASSGRGIGPSHSQEMNIHALGRIRTIKPSKSAAADLHLSPLGLRDRRMFTPNKMKSLVQTRSYSAPFSFGPTTTISAIATATKLTITATTMVNMK